MDAAVLEGSEWDLERRVLVKGRFLILGVLFISPFKSSNSVQSAIAIEMHFGIKTTAMRNEESQHGA